MEKPYSSDAPFGPVFAWENSLYKPRSKRIAYFSWGITPANSDKNDISSLGLAE